MRRKRPGSESGPLTLGQALAARVRVHVRCKACGHRAEPGLAQQAERIGAEITVIDWAKRLRCSACGARQVDFVVSGA